MIRNKLYYTWILFGFMFPFNKTFAQDLVYNNYKLVPLSSNPSLIALDNEMKLFLSYKYQNSKFSENFHTGNLSFIYPLINKTTNQRWGGLGITIRSNELSNIGFLSTSGADLAFAYQLKISKNHIVSASLQSSWNYLRLNNDKYTTGSQYNPITGFDQSLPANENPINESKAYFELATGVIWSYQDDYELPVYLFGVSAYHLNKPDISFFDTPQYLPVRYNVIAGVRVFSNNKFMIFPDVFYTYLNGYNYVNIGTKFSFNLANEESKRSKNMSISFTPRYVVNNSMALGVELKKSNYTFVFTYDYNTSRFSNNPVYYNGAEFVIGFRKLLGNSKQPNHLLFADDYKVGEKKNVIIKKEEKYEEGYEEGYQKAKNESENNSDKKLTKYADESWATAIIQTKTQITFPTNSAEFSPEAEEFFINIAINLKENPDYTLEIIGHADSIGSPAKNMKVSLQRAQNVAKFIEKQGIDPKRLKITAKGDTEPVSGNNTEEGRRLNRRVEFVIYKAIKKKK